MTKGQALHHFPGLRTDPKHFQLKLKEATRGQTDHKSRTLVDRRRHLVKSIIAPKTRCNECNTIVQDVFIFCDHTGGHAMRPHCFCETCYDAKLPAGGESGLDNRERQALCTCCPGGNHPGNHKLIGSNAVLVVRSTRADLQEKIKQGPNTGYRYSDERSDLLEDAGKNQRKRFTCWTAKDSSDEYKLDHRVSYDDFKTSAHGS